MRGPRGTSVTAATLVLAFLGGCAIPGRHAGDPTAIETTEAKATVASPSPAASVASDDFSTAAINYFSEIALGAEYGDPSAAVHKWTTDVRIAVHGDPTAEDRATLDDVVADLNALIGPIEVSIVRSKANIDMYFAPESEFSSIAPEYIPTNMGFFWTWWEGDGSISSARILASTTDISQTERDHIIREEVTQSLGLMNDSYTYEDSMFYQGWTSPTQYSALDENLIEMLYLPAITPGMSAAEALDALRGT